MSRRARISFTRVRSAPAEQPCRLGGEVVGRLGGAVEMRGDKVGAATSGADLVDDCGAALLAAAAEDDVRSLGGERDGDGAADVAGGASDERCLAFETGTQTAPPFVSMERGRY
jgi:hypothetical protein